MKNNYNFDFLYNVHMSIISILRLRTCPNGDENDVYSLSCCAMRICKQDVSIVYSYPQNVNILNCIAHAYVINNILRMHNAYIINNILRMRTLLTIYCACVHRSLSLFHCV